MVTRRTNLAYEEEDTTLYENLTQKANSPFYKLKYADVFLFSVCLARINNLPEKKIKNKKPNIPLDALKDKKWLFYAIEISDKNTHKVIFNEEKILERMELLANSGIKFLYKKFFDETDDFYKYIELLNKEIILEVNNPGGEV
jgi:hypothetical protein